MRGRLGVLLTPSTMAYAAGGIAWQHSDVTLLCASTQCFALMIGLLTATGGALSDSATKAGWTIGGGLETALWDRWLVRAEYRYEDFGKSSVTFTRSSPDPGFNPVVETFDV